jgi:hypothetical protein
MSDGFSGYADSASAPARRVVAIIPSDGDDLPDTPKGIYVGTGGDVALVAAGAPAGGAATVFRNLPSGALLPVRVRRVAATGTTAADLLALL